MSTVCLPKAFVSAKGSFRNTQRAFPSRNGSTFGLIKRSGALFNNNKRAYCNESKKNENENDQENVNNETSNNEETATIDYPVEFEKLKKELNNAHIMISTLKDEIIRARFDAENTRKIALRDVENAKEYGVTSFAKGILDVNDNLKRALDSINSTDIEHNTKLSALYEGVSMTKNILVHVLEKQGIIEYESLNSPFNPSIHEALFRIPYAEGLEPNSVGSVIVSGYKIKNRVLRAAQVGVVDAKPESQDDNTPNTENNNA
jgi:molecular chaperone GrpE